MKNNLIALYNTLSKVETKGESTKHMSNSLKFLEQMIVEAEKAESLEKRLKPVEKTEDKPEEETEEGDDQ